MSVVDRSYEHPMKPEEHGVMSLAGGIMGNGYQCGMLWGAALAAGAQAYRLYGPGPQAEAAAILAAQKLVDSFRARNKEINCLEITQLNWNNSSQSQRGFTMQILKFFLRGGPIGCFRMAARYAPLAFNEIEASLSDGNFSAQHDELPAGPLSCATLVAQKLGASAMHASMAAGFAGGIGLSGGGCGALGAAIWLIEMENAGKASPAGGTASLEDSNGAGSSGGGMALGSPQALAAAERFLKAADYEYECAAIVGRKFESAADHAAHIRGGGCAKILEALAVETVE
ncbi:MAG: C-GCAxxG-C-C family (seleno)protein [Chloroflexota bacterium]